MANKRAGEVRYTKFRANPLLADGLLGVERDSGEAQRRVSAAFARLADQAGRIGDRYAASEGEAAGLRDALAGSPSASTITGGVTSRTAADAATGLAASADLEQRAAYVRDGFIKRGLTPIQAAALAGHARQESGYRTGVRGDNGTAEGYFQWRGERLVRGKAFARARGADWYDTDTQLDYTVHELKTREKRAWTALQNAKTLEEATAAVMHFERPQGYTARNPRGGHGWDNRLAYAAWAAGLGGGGGGGAITERSVEPASVTGSGGGFRPMAGNSIRAQAYNAAGTRTYLEMLDATMRQDIATVYDRFGEDPAELDRALDALHTVHQSEHVFPEIAGGYEVAFRRVAEPYRGQAARNLERRQEVENRAAFIARTEDMETSKARAIAEFDPDSEDAAGAIHAAQQAVDAHYDSAVARGIMDADDAEVAKVKSRQDAAARFYTKQAAALTSAEDVAALRETMRADFVAGKLDGVDAGAWDAISSGLDRIERAKTAEARIARRALTRRGDQLADAVLAGADPMSADVSRFLLDAKTAPGGSEIAERTTARIEAAQALRSKTLPEAERYVRGLERDPAARESGLAGFARTAFDRTEKAVRNDPVGAAETIGLIEPQPDLFGDGADLATVAGRVTARIDVAEAVAEHYGVAPRYLRAGEAKALRALGDSDPAAAAEIAGGLVSGAGPAAGKVLAELGTDAPSLLQAGMILAGGGSAAAARDVIAGYGKGPDGNRLPTVKKEIRDAATADVYGDAYAGAPRDGAAIAAAAEAIAKARAVEAGIDPKSEDARLLYDRALQDAAGAVYENGVQYGGIAEVKRGGWLGSTHKTVVPSSIRADRFGDVIDAIRDQDLAEAAPYMSAPPVDPDGKPYPAADIKAARPVAVAGGYRFAFGDPMSDDPQWIAGADGRPFVLSIDGMRDRLEPRAPGAWR